MPLCKHIKFILDVQTVGGEGEVNIFSQKGRKGDRQINGEKYRENLKYGLINRFNNNLYRYIDRIGGIKLEE